MFVNASSVPVSSFLEIRTFYLNSAFVEWRNELYTQKSGICIGSKVAPVLSDIFLSKVDRDLERNLHGMCTKVFRYVDDFLIVTEPCHIVSRVPDVLKVFKECGHGLKFTLELPKQNQIQFLDLKLDLQASHVCWEYSPRSKKPVLNFNSGHSKIVKAGIAVSCLRNVFAKSCAHKYLNSFSSQMERLGKAGYDRQVMRLAVEKVKKWVKCGSLTRENRELES